MTQDWEHLWEIERDICYLYHNLAEVRGIDGDLPYGTLYALPYWEWLNLAESEFSQNHRQFVRDGCLVMLLAMAWEIIDGAGSYLQAHLKECRSALSNLDVDDINTAKLVETVSLALSCVETQTRSKELEELSIWVNHTYVQGYFKRMSYGLRSAV